MPPAYSEHTTRDDQAKTLADELVALVHSTADYQTAVRLVQARVRPLFDLGDGRGAAP